MTSGQNVLTPGYVNYPDSSHSLAFPLWIISGLPVSRYSLPVARQTISGSPVYARKYEHQRELRRWQAQDSISCATA